MSSKVVEKREEKTECATKMAIGCFSSTRPYGKIIIVFECGARLRVAGRSRKHLINTDCKEPQLPFSNHLHNRNSSTPSNSLSEHSTRRKFFNQTNPLNHGEPPPSHSNWRAARVRVVTTKGSEAFTPRMKYQSSRTPKTQNVNITARVAIIIL
ncbi:hypothetical protein, unlikely [Trypanosoma brucei gambiense DAL972]|uniref:Uncharacterized protein n=1 Tax=Trypanosoma brucei gambiense (strain MHOM/CI/86/DAL972) TaxID=679716 RepID=C9ZKB5_TRYB9|nr:hypothetical protein, unlikely [Trypanosoma brucei gambiense DAL972]CBH09879.1 hypothetical protein, unlikely [Trypanosoma brucei gambiense DAL972]|eukprot:XP_011772172.1 hypothetical protein, unlikely [Trypanosoma brucei gambiense DAL972]